MAHAIKGFVLVLAVAFAFSFGPEASAKSTKCKTRKSCDKCACQKCHVHKTHVKHCKTHAKKSRKCCRQC
jgi:hypothetical protein